MLVEQGGTFWLASVALRTEHVFNDDVMGADRATDHVSMAKFSRELR
jgi:hypothetical protein